MRIDMPEIKKFAVLKIEKDFYDEFENATLTIYASAEITINDEKVTFEEESTIYGLMDKDINDIRTEIDGTANGLTQYVKEKATKLINVILAAKEHCESNNISFDIKIV